MDRKYVSKTIFLNIYMLYTVYIFTGLIDYEKLMWVGTEIIFMIMTILFVFFRCWGMLSKLVRSDFEYIQKSHLIKIAEYVELFLGIGFVSVLLLGTYVRSLLPIWGVLFILSYVIYILFLVYYTVLRKKYNI